MGKFDNSFDGISGNKEGSGDYVKVDWASYNKGLIAAAGTQARARNMVGVVSGLIDLGIQPLDDAKVEWKGTPEEEAAEQGDNSNTYFEDSFDSQSKTTKRYKRWPQKPQRAVAITVDFPKLQFNYGEFFGNEGAKPVPIRTLLNGEFTPKGKKPFEAICGRVYDLKETTKDFAPLWSLAANSVLYKLAVATDVIEQGQPFTSKDIGKLIGKYAQFEVRIWGEGGYLQEKVAFKGRVSDEAVELGMPVYDEDILYFIRLDAENEEQHVKQLRRTIKNTIKRSSSYEGSMLQKQYDSILFPVFEKKEKTEEEGASKQTAGKTEVKKAPVEIPQYDESDIPFN